MKYPVTQWKQLNYSDDLIALNCVKEYLVEEMAKIRQDQNEQEEKAAKAGINRYIINIFIKKLDERKDHLAHLLDGVLHNIKNIK